jgi:hypothetical protein
MFGDVFENAVQRSCPKGGVTRHRDMVLAPCLRGQPEMRAFLPARHVAKTLEQPDEIGPGDVPREPRTHGAEISSRTMCSRMIFGTRPSSK